MKWAFLLAFLLLSSTAYAKEDPNKWTTTDTLLQVADTLLLVVDWRQTMSIAKSANQRPLEYKQLADGTWVTISYSTTHTYEERSSTSFLGKHPSEGRVNGYFIPIIIGQAVISFALPRPYRTIWQSTFIVVESYHTYRNYQVGIRMDIP